MAELYMTLECSAPYEGLLSSSCGGLGPFGPKVDFAGRTDEQTNGQREGN